jgi:DNA-binding NarL/FixJ family response regulator
MTGAVGVWEHRPVGRTVVVVDDHAGFRALAARLLTAAGWDVVASCPDGRSALAAVRELRPDVVLLDVQLPDIDGFAVLARLGEAEAEAGTEAPGPTVVLVSTRDAADYGTRIGRSGAAGFIGKADLSAGALAAVVGG